MTDHPHQQVVTLWFITAADPRGVLVAEPQADRGYARKLLAQLNPAWPLTHIGDFDMNRSAPPGEGEFYIGGYRGLTVVQTVLPDVPVGWSLSGLTTLTEPFSTLTSMIPTADLLVTVHTPTNRDGLGGFAHWIGGRMTRCFYATRERIIEDTGVPLPDEAAFWAGESEAPQARGIELPFRPSEMAAAAIAHWLGFRVSDEIDIPVAAFAVDGRPEMRGGHPDAPATRRQVSVTAMPDATPLRSGEDGDAPGDADAAYDDYADRPVNQDESRSTGELVKGAAVSVGRGLRTGVGWIRTGMHRIGDEVRRRARNTGR
ncbi:DUF6928 family protein [uncultured Corynebacterium sp.]|uniref:DUF6928 family protein n=1 Tax=uncultured Corynebacterium sp. TaxID=159447 RepID=UPI0025E0D3D3|nr:hypothetical protein [uncultured Corynebacterium sp.]